MESPTDGAQPEAPSLPEVLAAGQNLAVVASVLVVRLKKSHPQAAEVVQGAIEDWLRLYRQHMGEVSHDGRP